MTAPLSAAQILRAAAEIVERPGKWTRGALARDAMMREVNNYVGDWNDGAARTPRARP